MARHAALVAALAAVVVALAAVPGALALDYSFSLNNLPSPGGLSSNARFGAAVALDGHLVAVGAPGQNGEGAVVVYNCQGAGLSCSIVTMLTPPGNLRELLLWYDGPGSNGEFGAAVAVRNYSIMVGAPTYGLAFHYVCNEALTACSCLTGSPADCILMWPDNNGEVYATSRMGTAVAVGAVELVVTATNVTMVDAPASQGRAYVYQCSRETGSCSPDVIQLHPPETETNTYDDFGRSATYGSAGFMAIGAPNATVTGAVWVYACGDGDCINEDPFHILPPDTVTDAARFGAAVDSDGAWVAVGAPGIGVVYRYNCVDNGPGTTPECTLAGSVARQGSAGNDFGATVAVAGSSLAVGAPKENNGEGAVYLYECDATTCTPLQSVTAETNANHGFGQSLDMIADFFVIVGAPATEVGTAFYLAYVAKADVPFPVWGILLIVIGVGLLLALLGYAIYRCRKPSKNYSSLDEAAATGGSRYT